MTGGSVRIMGFTGTVVDLHIPPNIGGSPVGEIAAEAFRDCGIASVDIRASVVGIGENAFASNMLTAVTVPHGAIFENGAFGNAEATAAADYDREVIRACACVQRK